MRWVTGLCAGLGLALLGLAGAHAQTDSPLVQPNPAAVIGRLPNGLRYAVMTRPTTDHAAMTLYIDAGADEENASDAGAADLITHIGFASPQDLGQAARTARSGALDTNYVLDIPGSSGAQLRAGLAWLRGVADGLRLTPAEVDAARKELTANAVRQDKTDTALRAAAAGLFTPQLHPSRGQTASTDQVAAFYRRWYRPDNAIVVLVSPLPTDQLQALVVQAFDDWRKPQAALAHPNFAPPDPARPLQAAAFSAPSLLAAVQVCRTATAAAPEPESVSVWRRRLADDAWAFALQGRLNRLAQAGNPPLAEIGATLQTDTRLKLDQACIRAGGLDQDWRADLTAAEHEARRLALYGVTDEELDRFKAAQQAQLTTAVQAAAHTPPIDLVDIILNNLLSGDTFDTVQEDQRVHSLALQALDKAAVDAAFASHWSKAGQPLMLVTTADPASAEEIRAAWRKAEADPLTPPPAHTPADEPARGTSKPSGATVAVAADAGGAS